MRADPELARFRRPATAIGGYQLMFMVCVAWPVCRVKKSGSSPSAAAPSTSSSSASARIRAR